jgi:hypothetical protein
MNFLVKSLSDQCPGVLRIQVRCAVFGQGRLCRVDQIKIPPSPFFSFLFFVWTTHNLHLDDSLHGLYLRKLMDFTVYERACVQTK